MAIRARLLSGEAVEVTLEGAASLGEVRERLQRELGVVTSRYRLQLSEGTCLLDDEASPGVCGTAPGACREISATLRPLAPPWYPVGKYMHAGKDVLSVEWADNVWRSEDRPEGTVHYIDGSSASLCDKSSDDGTEQILPTDLVRDFGFVTHTVDFTFDEFGDEFFWKEAVPTEDPGEWETVQHPLLAGVLEHRRQPAAEQGGGGDDCQGRERGQAPRSGRREGRHWDGWGVTYEVSGKAATVARRRSSKLPPRSKAGAVVPRSGPSASGVDTTVCSCLRWLWSQTTRGRLLEQPG